MANPGPASSVSSPALGTGSPYSLGTSASSLVGAYGATPVVQRASSNQVASNMVTSASFGASQVAIIQEIMNTLTGLGLWKGAA